jgi:hypothetical protein
MIFLDGAATAEGHRRLWRCAHLPGRGAQIRREEFMKSIKVATEFARCAALCGVLALTSVCHAATDTPEQECSRWGLMAGEIVKQRNAGASYEAVIDKIRKDTADSAARSTFQVMAHQLYNDNDVKHLSQDGARKEFYDRCLIVMGNRS